MSQAPQSGFYRRGKFEICLAIPPTQSVCGMEISMRNIILIGMPGSGKSTVGVVLAKKLGYKFIDSDLIIQEKYNATLERLIEKYGDAGFIKLENDVNAAIDVKKTVIATGGSAVYGQQAMEHFKEIGTVIYLDVSKEELEERLGSLKERGVVSNGKTTIEEIFEDRRNLYKKYADMTINLNNKILRESVEEIYDLVVNKDNNY